MIRRIGIGALRCPPFRRYPLPSLGRILGLSGEHAFLDKPIDQDRKIMMHACEPVYRDSEGHDGISPDNVTIHLTDLDEVEANDPVPNRYGLDAVSINR
jgi:hypothetical protein